MTTAELERDRDIWAKRFWDAGLMADRVDEVAKIVFNEHDSNFAPSVSKFTATWKRLEAEERVKTTLSSRRCPYCSDKRVGKPCPYHTQKGPSVVTGDPQNHLSDRASEFISLVEEKNL